MTIALIGSAFQLMSLFEAIRCGAVEPGPDVLVQNLDPSTVDVVERGRDLLGAVNTVHSSVDVLRCVKRLSVSDRVILGDVYSGLAQVALSFDPRSDRSVTILEDGASVLRVREALAGDRVEFTRSHSVSRRRHVLGSRFGAAMRRAADNGRLTVVGGLPIRREVEQKLRSAGIVVVRHAFAWTRSASDAVWPGGDHSSAQLVIGSALAADGLVHEDRYLAWLESTMCARPTVFWPHRRESVSARDVARRCGASLVVSGLERPVELVLNAAGCPRSLVTLPTTVALSARLVSTEIAVEVSHVPDAWWASISATPMRELTAAILALSETENS